MEARHKFAIIAGLTLLVLSFILFKNTPFLSIFVVISIIIAVSQFWIDFLNYNRKQKEIERNFPEFVRNFVDAVKSGMPATKAIIAVADEDYSSLNPYVQKLKHQLEWNIPFHKALKNFADSTNNILIKRAISTVIEAEKAGGNIVDVLSTITTSLLEIKKIKQQRRASMHASILQNYIIFLVFLGIIVIIQNFLIPYMSRLGQGTFASLGATQNPFNIPRTVSVNFSSLASFKNSVSQWFLSINGIFMMLAIIQGFFAGLVTGIMVEGDIRYGVKHSAALMLMSFLIISLAQAFL